MLPNHFYPNPNNHHGFGFHHQPPIPSNNNNNSMIYGNLPQSTPIQHQMVHSHDHHEVPTSSLMVNPSPPSSTPLPNHHLHHHQYNSSSPSPPPISINLKQSAEAIMMDSIKLNQYENTIYLNQLSHSKDFEIHRRKVSSDLEQIKLLHGEVTQLQTQIKTLNEKRKEYLKSLYGNHSIIGDDEDEEDELDIETLLMEYEYNVNNDMYTPHHLPKSMTLTNVNNNVNNMTNNNINSATNNITHNPQTNNAILGGSSLHHTTNTAPLPNTKAIPSNQLHNHHNTDLTPPQAAHSRSSNAVPDQPPQTAQQESTISNNHSNPTATTSTTPNHALNTTSTSIAQTTSRKPSHKTAQQNSLNTPLPPPSNNLHGEDDAQSITSAITTTSTNYTNNFKISTPSKSKQKEHRNDDTISTTSLNTSRTSIKSKNKTNIIVESKKRKEVVDIDDSDDEDNKFSLFKSPKKPKLDQSAKEMLKIKKRQAIEEQKKMHLMNRFDEKEYIVIANNSTPPPVEKVEKIESSPPKSKLPSIEEEVIKSPTIHQQVVNLVEEENTENSIGDDILYYSLLSGCVKKDEPKDDATTQKNPSLTPPVQNSSSTNTNGKAIGNAVGSVNPAQNLGSSSDDSSGDEEEYAKYFKSTKKKKKSKKPGIDCEECREFYEACFPNDEEKRNRIIRECSRHRHGHHHQHITSPSLNQSPVIVGGNQQTSATHQSTPSSTVTKQPSVNFDSVQGTPPDYWNLGDGPTDTYEIDSETQMSKSY